MKKLLRFVLTILLTTLFVNFIVVSAAVETSFGGAHYRVAKTEVSHVLPFDVKHTTDIGYSGLSSAKDPQIVNVVDVPVESGLEVIPWSKLGSSRWNLASLTSMARDFEEQNPGYRVIAGINGDFFDINGNQNLPYATVGVHASFGNIYKSTPATTTARKPIGFKNDGSTKPIVGNVAYEKTEKMVLAIYDNKDIIAQIDIDKVNTNPSEGEISLFYANWVAKREIGPISAPMGYVVSNAEYALAFSETDFYGLGKITSIASKVLEEGEFSVVSNNDEINELLKIGTKIRVQYELAGAFANVENATGAGKPIIYDGKFYADTTDFGTARHPRTMVGSKADGSIVLCVVDGRQTGMTGVAQPEMAAIMSHYGCVDAYNLDGGGSTTMIILNDGELEVTNTPSDGRERSDSNCLLIVVRVPSISLEFTKIKQNSLSLEASLDDLNGYQIDDLYVEINNVKQKISRETIVFDNLESNTPYVYDFYIYYNNRYEKIPIQGKITTAKEIPILKMVELVKEGDGLGIYLSFKDPDNALERKKVIVGEQVSIVVLNYTYFSKWPETIQPLLVGYSYNINNNEGRVDVELDVFSLRCSLSTFLVMTKDNLNNSLLDILN